MAADLIRGGFWFHDPGRVRGAGPHFNPYNKMHGGPDDEDTGWRGKGAPLGYHGVAWGSVIYESWKLEFELARPPKLKRDHR